MTALNSNNLTGGRPKPGDVVVSHGITAAPVRRVVFREDAKIEGRHPGVIYVFDADLAAHYVAAGKADYADPEPEAGEPQAQAMDGPPANRSMRSRKG